MLDISFGLILLTAIVFFILVFLLNSWLYRPLITFMEEREKSIKEDLEKAQANESGSQKLLEEAKAIIAQAKSEAAKLKSEVIAKEKEEMQKLLEAKRNELEKKYQAFAKELEEEEQSLKAALISQLPLFKEALKAKFNKL